MKIHEVTVFVLLSMYVFQHGNMELFDSAFEQDLDRFIEDVMECNHIPGLTVSVVKGSETWTRGYGTADFSKSRMVDNTTLFNIGSVTKSFTMVLLGILLDEKGLDWNTKVHDILGSDYEFIDEYRTKETTLRDLLSHRTGLASIDIGWLAGYPAELTREMLSKKIKHLEQSSPFRDGYSYNNMMYMILGHVTEKLGGDTWENLVTSKVLLPIGMTSTKIFKEPEDMLKSDVAKPYIFKDGIFQNGTLKYSLHPLEPVGAMLSSGVDMVKYMRFNLDGGVTDDGKPLLDQQLLFKAFTATVSTPGNGFRRRHFLTLPEYPVADTSFGYGYAWFIGTYRGYLKVWHSGGLFSYVTYLWMFPDINTGVFASINGPAISRTPGYGIRTILTYITDKLMEKEQWLDETNVCEYPQFWRNYTSNSRLQEPSVTLQNPSEYIGSYGNYFLPSVQVTTKLGDDTFLRFQMNQLGGILHSTKDKDRFLMEITSPWEYMVSYLDENNNPRMINSKFMRNKKDIVESLEVDLDVRVVYSKDVSILTNAVSGTSSCYYLPNSQLLFVVILVRTIHNYGT